MARLPLEFTGTASRFEARWTPDQGGVYEIQVWGYDPGTGNTGIDRTTVIVSE